MHRMCLNITWKFCSGKLVILIQFHLSSNYVPSFQTSIDYSIKVIQLFHQMLVFLTEQTLNHIIVSLLIMNIDILLER
jgi:hypothetical protein